MRILLFLTLFIATGCATSYHYAEFLEPSNRFVPADVKRVAVINRGATKNSETVIYSGGIPMEEVKGLSAKLAKHTIDVFITNVSEMGRFEVVEITEQLSRGDASEYIAPKLKQSTIDSIISKYNLDAIISLEGAELNIHTAGRVGVITVNDRNGMPVQVPEFQAEREFTYGLAWRIYDKKPGKIGDEYETLIQRVYTNAGFSEQTAAGNLPDIDKNLLDLGTVAGNDYFFRVSPHWGEDYRRYYTSGHSKLTDAAYYVRVENDWEKAALLWSELTQSDDRKTAYRASYNMAVASEMFGKPELAKTWLEKAMAVKSTKAAKDYMQTLEEQIIVYRLVNKQLGIDLQ